MKLTNLYCSKTAPSLCIQVILLNCNLQKFKHKPCLKVSNSLLTDDMIRWIDSLPLMHWSVGLSVAIIHKSISPEICVFANSFSCIYLMIFSAWRGTPKAFRVPLWTPWRKQFRWSWEFCLTGPTSCHSIPTWEIEWQCSLLDDTSWQSSFGCVTTTCTGSFSPAFWWHGSWRT